MTSSHNDVIKLVYDCVTESLIDSAASRREPTADRCIAMLQLHTDTLSIVVGKLLLSGASLSVIISPKSISASVPLWTWRCDTPACPVVRGQPTRPVPPRSTALVLSLWRCAAYRYCGFIVDVYLAKFRFRTSH